MRDPVTLWREHGLIGLAERTWARVFGWVAGWRLSHALGRLRNVWRLSGLSRRHRYGKLNLGCGKDRRSGFLNVDLGLAGELHVDVRRPFPFPDGHFALVFSEHMIEHLTEAEAARCLRECYRVLQPAGVLRLSTPDLAFQIKMYQDGNEGGRAFRRAAASAMPWKYSAGEVTTPAQGLNDALCQWGHCHLYDREDLERVLRAAGFSEITFHEPAEGSQELTAGLESRRDGSLAVEAVKGRVGTMNDE